MSDGHPEVGHRTGWREVLAFAAFAAIVVQLLGGVALSFHYVPAVDAAHASLLALEQDHKYGVSLRALHWLGASAVVGLVLVNLLLAFLAGDHKRPGRAAWISGVLLLFVVIGFGITGELLPWTEQAVLAAEVRTGLIGAAPEGEVIRAAVIGGDAIAEPTLTRFHTLHVVVLPLVLVALLVWHVRARRRIGRPRFVTLGQAVAAVVVTAALAFGARELRAPLGALFVPGDVGFEARPEWYFLWLNELLRIFPAELAAIPAFWIPNGLAVLLLLLPFLDVRRERSWRRRPIATILAIVLVLTLVGLSIANLRDDEPLPTPAAAGGEATVQPAGEAKPTDDAPHRPLPYSLDFTPLERRGYMLVRQQGCAECHRLEIDGVAYGETKHEAPEFDAMDGAAPVDYLASIVENAERELGTPDMPPFDHLTWADLHAIALWIKRLNPPD